jgi:beta-lactam-binding protein with PASTA domain
MPSSFSVSAASPTIALDRNQATATFTVSNVSPVPVRGRLKVEPIPPTQASWLALDGEAEREFATNQAEQVRVKIAVPGGSPAAAYPFRLNLYSIALPDDDFTEGPVVTFEVKAPPPPQPLPWKLILGLVAAVLVVAAVATVVVLMQPKPVPDVTGMSLDAAKVKLEAAGLKVDVEEVVSDAEPGTVLEQDPPGDAKRPPDGKVKLTAEASLVDVPVLVGLKEEEAKREVEQRGLHYQVEGTFLNTDPTTVGKVKEQDPKPNRDKVARKLSSVLVVLNQDGVVVPTDLAGKVWNDTTKKKLTDAGLVVGMVGSGQGPPGTVADTILDLDPDGGSKVARYTPLNIAIHRLPPPVPVLEGKSLTEALNLLAGYGMKAKIKYEFIKGAQAGVVKKQHPSAGQPLPAGQPVELTVARGGWVTVADIDKIIWNKPKLNPVILSGNPSLKLDLLEKAHK